MKFYSVESFTKNIKETPEGFLACEGVAIARTGVLKYMRGEVPIEPNSVGEIEVERTADVLFSDDCLASFEGKPITLNHPPDFVTPDNWREYAVGTLQNVRGDGEFLLADLLITDENAISFVKSGELRELSCGYEADYTDTGVGKGRQTRIIGNHVALVPEGRCGASCAIFDASPEPKGMSMKERLKKLLWRAIDEAPELKEEKAETSEPEEKVKGEEAISLDQLVADLAQRVAVLENKSGMVEEPPAEEKIVDEPPAEPPAECDLSTRLDAIESLLKQIVGTSQDAEQVEEPKNDGVFNTDAATLTAGAILAPNLEPCENYTQKALTEAYATADGKQVIDTVLSGRAFDEAQNELSLFFASAELLKQKRRAVIDANPAVKEKRLGGIVTPEALNEYYSTLYKGD